MILRRSNSTPRLYGQCTKCCLRCRSVVPTERNAVERRQMQGDDHRLKELYNFSLVVAAGKEPPVSSCVKILGVLYKLEME